MIQVLTVNTLKLNETLTAQGLEKGLIVEGTSLKVLDKIGFIETPSGVVVTDAEGVHYDPAPSTDKISINVYEETQREGGTTLSMLPKLAISVNLDELKGEGLINEETVPVLTFVRSFGARLENNFSELLETLQFAGLDVTADREKRRKR